MFDEFLTSFFGIFQKSFKKEADFLSYINLPNPKRTGDLQQFLAGREVNGEIELKRSFNNISNELPEILAKVGNYIESPELTKAARRWMQNKNEYENYIDSLGDDEDDYDD